MVRQARIDYPGALNHVMARGIEKRDIFKTTGEKQELVNRLGKLLGKSDMQCYAWCVMDNHFHLLIETGEVTSLETLMRRLLTGYAVWYNKSHERVGHLFQNRYKSIVCDKDSYLLPLIRYIHLNPVRSRKVGLDDLDMYSWTGHSELVIDNVGQELLDKESVLGYFSSDPNAAKDVYMQFLRDGLDIKEDYSGGGLMRSLVNFEEEEPVGKGDRSDARILGVNSFVNDVLKKIYKGKLSNIKTFEDLLDLLSKRYGVSQNEILASRKPKAVRVRSVLIYLGNSYLKEGISSLSKRFGISEVSVHKAKKRAESLLSLKEKEAIEEIGK